MNKKNHSLHLLLYFCFAASGAAGLIYEVVWSRQLGLFLGITTYAHTAVIAAFMLGLASGCWFFGSRMARWKSPLKAYALLEALIALFGLLSLGLVPAVQQLYGTWFASAGLEGLSAHLIRFATALLLFLLPSFLMGGTLPLMIMGLTHKKPELASNTGRLYGMNTMGAMLGAFAAGYLLLPALGMRGTIFFAAALNVSAALIVGTMDRVLRRTSTAAPREPEGSDPGYVPTRGQYIGVLAGYAVSGLAAMIYQLVWIRSLTLVIGSSVYSFSATLTVYLAGLGLGSLLYPRLFPAKTQDTEHYTRRLSQAGLLQGLIGASAIAGLYMIGSFPDLLIRSLAGAGSSGFFRIQMVTFGLSFLLMMLPTLLLGLVFPLITDLCNRRGTAEGQTVGRVYAANTFGTVTGVLLAGLFLVPEIGIHTSLILAAGLHALVGLLFIRLGQRRFSWMALGGLTVFGLLVWGAPAWNREVMMSGAFMNTTFLDQENVTTSYSSHMENNYKTIYYNEGRDGVVSVRETATQVSLVINGKVDASSEGDLQTQYMLGHLPMFIHPDPEQVLIIGLGSGITVGAVAQHASPSSIDTVEISEEVVEASAFFKHKNANALEDPRTRLILGDARNYLTGADKRYDVIISEPSNPWISGVSNLFTEDFFRLLHEKLKPGGLLAQWFHIYNMSIEDVKMVMQTYLSVFPHVTVWKYTNADLIFIGSDEPHSLDYRQYRKLAGQNKIRGQLSEVNLGDLPSFTKAFLMDTEQITTFSSGSPLNTDNRPRLEFSAPKHLFSGGALTNKLQMFQFLDEKLINTPIRGLAQMRGPYIYAPFLARRIRIESTQHRQDWNTGWQLWRKVVELEGGIMNHVGLASQGQLTWSDGLQENRIQINGYSKAPTAEEIKSIATREAGPALRQAGKITIPPGRPGYWAIAQKDQNRIEIHVVWGDTIEESPVRIDAESLQPDPGNEAWGQALVEFVKKLEPATEDPAEAFSPAH